MTPRKRKSVWRLVLGATGDLGDALATPRGVAPDRALHRATARRERA